MHSKQIPDHADFGMGSLLHSGTPAAQRGGDRGDHTIRALFGLADAEPFSDLNGDFWTSILLSDGCVHSTDHALGNNNRLGYEADLTLSPFSPFAATQTATRRNYGTIANVPEVCARQDPASLRSTHHWDPCGTFLSAATGDVFSLPHVAQPHLLFGSLAHGYTTAAIYSEPVSTPSASSDSTYPLQAPDLTPIDGITPRALQGMAKELYKKSPEDITEEQRARCVRKILAKRERNARSAQKRRQKQKEEIEALERQVRELTDINIGLKSRTARLEMDLRVLAVLR